MTQANDNTKTATTPADSNLPYYDQIAVTNPINWAKNSKSQSELLRALAPNINNLELWLCIQLIFDIASFQCSFARKYL